MQSVEIVVQFVYTVKKISVIEKYNLFIHKN